MFGYILADAIHKLCLAGVSAFLKNGQSAQKRASETMNNAITNAQTWID